MISGMERHSEDRLPVHPMFNSLNDHQRRLMAQATEIRTYLAGEMLFRMGETAERFFMMLKGQVKLFRVSPSGQEKIVELFTPPNTFAEATIFMERRIYPVNAEALEDCEVAAFSSSVFRQILEESHETCLRLLGKLSVRLHQRLNDIDALALQNATLRVSNFLLQLIPQDADGSVSIALPYSKKNIAARLSLQPETLSRVFHRLKNAGVMETTGQEVRIADLDALRDIAING